jgi:hypothetical protein
MDVNSIHKLGCIYFQVLQTVESLMTATVDPAFRAIPKNSTAFLIWRIEVSDTVPTGTATPRHNGRVAQQLSRTKKYKCEIKLQHKNC